MAKQKQGRNGRGKGGNLSKAQVDDINKLDAALKQAEEARRITDPAVVTDIVNEVRSCGVSAIKDVQGIANRYGVQARDAVVIIKKVIGEINNETRTADRKAKRQAEIDGAVAMKRAAAEAKLLAERPALEAEITALRTVKEWREIWEDKDTDGIIPCLARNHGLRKGAVCHVVVTMQNAEGTAKDDFELQVEAQVALESYTGEAEDLEGKADWVALSLQLTDMAKAKKLVELVG